MTDTTFDTLEAAEALAHAGIQEPHAKAIAVTMRKAVSEGVATKADIREVEAKIDAVDAKVGSLRTELKAEIGAVKWILGFMLAVVLAMAGRMFGVL